MDEQTKIQKQLTPEILITSSQLQQFRMEVRRQRRMEEMQQTNSGIGSEKSQNQEASSLDLDKLLQEQNECMLNSFEIHKRQISYPQDQQAIMQKIKQSFDQNTKASQKIQLKFFHLFSSVEQLQTKGKKNQNYFQKQLQLLQTYQSSPVFNNLNIQQLENQDGINFSAFQNFEQQNQLGKGIQDNLNRINQEKSYEMPSMQFDQEISPILQNEVKHSESNEQKQLTQLIQKHFTFIYKYIVEIYDKFVDSIKEIGKFKSQSSCSSETK